MAEQPKKAEHLFDLVVHALYGERVRTINGAGGDGGMDAWVGDIGRALEFKSWTTLNDSRRKQVVRSLKTCLNKPEIRSWVLVAPVHPTPGDLKWFRGLTERHRVPFEMVFLDVRWLETQLINNPGIARFLRGHHQEALDALVTLGKEEALLLGGAPDLLARVCALGAVSDEASPVWAMDFSSRDGQDSVYIRPKPNIPPQQVQVALAVAEGDAAGERVAQDVAAAFDYGAGAVIEPGHITRVDNEALAALNLPWDKVGMVLSDQRFTAGFPHTATLRSRAADGTHGRPLYVTFSHATVGTRGMHVHGTDPTRMLKLRLLVDRPDGDNGSNVGMLLQYGPDNVEHAISADPQALLRTVETLDALDRTPGMVLTLTGDVEPIPLDASTWEPSGHFAPLATALTDFVVIRETLDVVLPLPVTWSSEYARNVAVLAGLLRDEEVSMPLSTVVCHQISTAEEARTYLDYIETGHGARLDFELVGWSLSVGDVQIPVGPLFVAFSRARITNAAEVVAALDAGDELVPVDLAPAPGSTVLGRRTPFPGLEPAAP
ncbi:hypothetical protein [Nocardia sp. NRRL S-836]|uniref:hypothetical protein n=1 Tax=Nocardia sp. NRRL S-836 TaxID=1519492 RepID=UPI0006AE207B|nr:hypothetical protein [Nocardia sp. NRRL S-836]KOV87613.1 hypothetical protein ADL03_06910 [Nocardia sp. NRRL S-836]